MERALFDPIAIDPTGVTTMDSWQPSKEGDRVAVQYSIGGDEESILAIIDTATGERLEDGIDRCRYSPIAWLPGGEQYYYVRRLAPELLPESEQEVPSSGLPPHRRREPGRGHPHLRRRYDDDQLLRRRGQPRWSLASGLGIGGHRTP